MRLLAVVAVVAASVACTSGQDETDDTLISFTNTTTTSTATAPTTTAAPPSLNGAAVNELLDQLPAAVADERFAGWEQTPSGSVVIRFTGEIPSEFIGIVSDSEFADSIAVEGGAEVALAAMQDVIGQGLHDIGVVQGGGGYRSDTRLHEADVAFGPEIERPSPAVVLANLNEVLTAGGLRPLLPHEVDFSIFDYVEPRVSPGG